MVVVGLVVILKDANSPAYNPVQTKSYQSCSLSRRNVNHKTCPICRATVKSTDDTWVLTEKPDESEMAYETTGYLMGLADRTGIPSKSPND